MIELKLQRPFVDEDGIVHENLEKHYAEDEEGNQYSIIQNETGVEYDEAVDSVPCIYTYSVTEKLVVKEEMVR